MDISLKFMDYRRGISTKRLKVSTVIHNFSLKRSDGKLRRINLGYNLSQKILR